MFQGLPALFVFGSVFPSDSSADATRTMGLRGALTLRLAVEEARGGACFPPAGEKQDVWWEEGNSLRSGDRV